MKRYIVTGILLLLFTPGCVSVPEMVLDETTSRQSFRAVNSDLSDEEVTITYQDGRQQEGILAEMAADTTHFHRLGELYNQYVPTRDIARIKEKENRSVFMYIGGAAAAGGALIALGWIPDHLNPLQEDAFFLHEYSLMFLGFSISYWGYRANVPTREYVLDHEVIEIQHSDSD